MDNFCGISARDASEVVFKPFPGKILNGNLFSADLSIMVIRRLEFAIL